MKKCINCGRVEENNNATMCSACGGALVNEVENGNYYPNAAPVPKRNTGVIVAIIVAAVLLVGGFVAGAIIFSNNQNEVVSNKDYDDKKSSSDSKNESVSSDTQNDVEEKPEEEKDQSISDKTGETKKEEEPEEVPEEEEAGEQVTEQKTVKLGETFTVGDTLEITLESSEWVETIYPSDTSGGYSYYEDKTGEKYFVIKGKAKNLTSSAMDIEHMQESELLVNGTYKFTANIEAEDLDGRGFFDSIKPLQTLDIIVYASVSDEAYEICDSVKVKMLIWDDADEKENSEYPYFYSDRHSHGIYTLELNN